jgi:hypothetical protein
MSEKDRATAEYLGDIARDIVDARTHRRHRKAVEYLAACLYEYCQEIVEPFDREEFTRIAMGKEVQG